MGSASQTSTQKDFAVDDGILVTLAPGTRVLSAVRLLVSSWATTVRLHVQHSHQPDGEETRYFVKSASGEHGRVMMRGEFHAMSELYRWAPDMVPKPHAWGQHAAEEAFFFIAEYVDMRPDGMPDPEQLCARLARLHRESASPTGQFGFAVTTCQGRVPQAVAWQASWTVFFQQLVSHVVQMDRQVNGDWAGLQILEKRLLERVVPRLLDALVAGGRSIRPCLIHADLWEGNTGTSADGRLVVFDAAAMYAHNEMEVADWRCYYNKISDEVYTRIYLEHVPPSEPQEEWEDRNRLYSIYYNIVYSVNHMSDGTAVRQLAYSDMYALIDKFAPFPPGEGPSRLDQSSMATLSSERDHTV